MAHILINPRTKLNDTVTIPLEDYKIDIGYDAKGNLAVLLRIGTNKRMGRIAMISPDKIEELEKLLAKHIRDNDPSEIFKHDNSGDFKMLLKMLWYGLRWWLYSRLPFMYHWFMQRTNKRENPLDNINYFFHARYKKSLKRLLKKTGRNIYGHWIE